MLHNKNNENNKFNKFNIVRYSYSSLTCFHSKACRGRFQRFQRMLQFIILTHFAPLFLVIDQPVHMIGAVEKFVNGEESSFDDCDMRERVFMLKKGEAVEDFVLFSWGTGWMA